MRKSAYIAIAAFLFFQSSQLWSQWQRVLYEPGKPVYSVYFLRDSSGIPQIGFAGLGTEIWRTGDAGKTWTRVSTGVSNPCQFAFKDSSIGWCADRGYGIFKTTDGGWTWFSLNLDHSCEGIYYNKLSGRLFFATWYGGIGYSDDEGTTWTKFPIDHYANSGIDFTSANDGIISSYLYPSGGNFLVTHDGGSSWTPLDFGQECWQLLAIHGSQTYFAACEYTGSGINRTDDGGTTWRILKNSFPTIQEKITGDIHGDLCRLYIQTYGHEDPLRPSGIMKSLDEGESWDFLEGPGSYGDRRFYTLGKYVYAGDTLGGVWILCDTLPIPLQNHIEFTSNVINFDTIINCSDPVVSINLKNHLSCYPAMIKKFQWSSVVGTNPFSLLSPTSSSRVVGTKSEDSLLIKFNSTGASKFISTLHITFTIDGHDIDTTISVRAVRKILPNASLSTASLEFDTIATCTEKILTATLINTGCDSEIIHVGNLPNDFILLEPLSDTIIHSEDSMILRIGLSGKITGIHSGSFKVNVIPKDFPQSSYDIDLEGYVTDMPNYPLINPPLINFDSVSFCDSTLTHASIVLWNPSDCDSLKIDSLWVEGETNLFSNISQTQFAIAPSGSQKLQMTFKSGNKGHHKANLHLRFNNGISERDTIITLQAFVHDGTKILSSSTSALDFGTVSVCDEKDTSIRLINSGCDTLVITGYGGLDLGFGTAAKFPIILLPGHDTSIDIFTLLDTAGGKTSSSATISFTSDADSISPIRPINLTRTYSTGSKNAVSFFLDPTPHSGGDKSTVIYNVRSNSNFTGVQSLGFDLSYNSNLLTFDSADSKNISSTDGDHFRMTPDTGSIIATVAFKVFLTKDSTTEIILTYGGDTLQVPCGILTISGGGSALFNYTFLCGDHSIQNFMNGVMPMRIISIRPNPAQDEIVVEVENPDGHMQCAPTIFDALGNQVFTSPQPLSLPRQGSIRIDTKNLSGGVYIVRIGTASQSFVKVK